MSDFFLFGSAVPFGIFAVTIVSRLRFMGVRAAGTNIALLGGLTATMGLILSGILGWVLSVPEVSASAQLVKAIFFLCFLFGGTVFAVGFGLLTAAVSVTSYFTRLLPRWLVALGMLLAVDPQFNDRHAGVLRRIRRHKGTDFRPCPICTDYEVERPGGCISKEQVVRSLLAWPHLLKLVPPLDEIGRQRG